MKSHDVEFKIRSGNYNGTAYRFTLAESGGQKRWQAVRLFNPPPSMEKEKIDMMIAISNKNIPISGAVDAKSVSNLFDQLDIIAKETTPVTLIGYDNIERLVRIDKGGYSFEPVISEKGKAPEYAVALTCWSIYE